MLLPVRCYTCNAVIAHMWDSYVRLSDSHGRGESLDKLNVSRMCCRRMFLCHVDFAGQEEYQHADIVLNKGTRIETTIRREVSFKRTVSCD